MSEVRSVCTPVIGGATGPSPGPCGRSARTFSTMLVLVSRAVIARLVAQHEAGDDEAHPRIVRLVAGREEPWLMMSGMLSSARSVLPNFTPTNSRMTMPSTKIGTAMTSVVEILTK